MQPRGRAGAQGVHALGQHTFVFLERQLELPDELRGLGMLAGTRLVQLTRDGLQAMGNQRMEILDVPGDVLARLVLHTRPGTHHLCHTCTLRVQVVGQSAYNCVRSPVREVDLR